MPPAFDLIRRTLLLYTTFDPVVHSLISVCWEISLETAAVLCQRHMHHMNWTNEKALLNVNIDSQASTCFFFGKTESTSGLLTCSKTCYTAVMSKREFFVDVQTSHLYFKNNGEFERLHVHDH